MGVDRRQREVRMQIEYLILALAGAPVLLASPATVAQEAVGAPAKETAADGGAGAYSLKSGDVGGGASAANAGLQAVAPSYQLGTGFGQRRGGGDEVILTAPVPERAAPIKTESGLWHYPAVSVGVGHNDNVVATETNPVGSNFLSLSTDIVSELKRQGDRYTASLSVDRTTYASAHDDNFTNYEVSLAGDNYFSQRARLGLAVGYLSRSDPRGSTNRPVSATPDRWTAPVAEGVFIYGAPGAQGRVEFDVRHLGKRYQNNRLYTEIADLDRTEVAGRFFLRMGSHSMALVEIRNAGNDYKSSLSSDDNTERRYYAGVTWEATAATTGTLKVGRMTKTFDQTGRPGYSGSSWEGIVRWLPRTYSAFDLQLFKEAADSTGVGNYVLGSGNVLAWNHKWTGYVGSRLAVGSYSYKYAGTTRTDDVRSYSATLGYDVLRWMTLGLDFARTDRSSTDPDAAFKRNVFMFTLNATF